jgi:hypothetical protein
MFLRVLFTHNKHCQMDFLLGKSSVRFHYNKFRLISFEEPIDSVQNIINLLLSILLKKFTNLKKSISSSQSTPRPQRIKDYRYEGKAECRLHRILTFVWNNYSCPNKRTGFIHYPPPKEEIIDRKGKAKCRLYRMLPFV